MYYRSSYCSGGPTQLFQGNNAALQRELKKTGKTVIRGGNGSYLLAQPSFGYISEFESENAVTPTRTFRPDKNFLRMRYDKSRVTSADYDRLASELNNGSISFDDLYNKFSV